MKKIVILSLGIILFSSCQQGNEEQQYQKEDLESDVEIITVDSLPDAKWNGEYMKIESQDREKGTRRQSYGADMYNMGTMKIFLNGKDTINFSIYERRKNVLTFNSSNLRLFIRSAFEEDVHLHFQKNNIVTQAKGKYKVDPTQQANNSVFMRIYATVGDEKKEFTMQKGEIEIKNFDVQLSRIELALEGTFITDSGEEIKGSGEMNLLFEESIMTVDE